MELRYTIKKTGAIYRGSAQAIVGEELNSALTEVVIFLEREVKARTPVGVFGAQAGLVAGIHGEVIGKGTPVMKGIVAPHVSHNYAEVVEKGRTPGKAMPPAGTLVRWIEQKLGVSETMAKSLEFVIRRKIGKKGFKGAHMFENAFNENFNNIQSMFEKGGFEISKRLDA